MKLSKLIAVSMCVVATNAMALDFETEWAKFSNDFAKLVKQSSVSVSVDVPRIGNVKPPIPKDNGVEIRVLDKEEKIEVKPLPSNNTSMNLLEQVDPKSPERLGHKLQNPEMKDYVTSLYKKPNVVVYSATLN